MLFRRFFIQLRTRSDPLIRKKRRALKKPGWFRQKMSRNFLEILHFCQRHFSCPEGKKSKLQSFAQFGNLLLLELLCIFVSKKMARIGEGRFEAKDRARWRSLEAEKWAGEEEGSWWKSQTRCNRFDRWGGNEVRCVRNGSWWHWSKTGEGKLILLLFKFSIWQIVHLSLVPIEKCWRRWSRTEVESLQGRRWADQGRRWTHRGGEGTHRTCKPRHCETWSLLIGFNLRI